MAMNTWTFLVLFLGAGILINLFAFFVLPWIRLRLAGDRAEWALRNGFNFERGDRAGFLESIGRPGLFAHGKGKAERVLRGTKLALVDYSYVAQLGGRASDSRSQRRLVTVAVGDSGRETPATSVVPKTMSLRLAEALVLQSLVTGDDEFDQMFHVDSGDLSGIARLAMDAKMRGALQEALHTDKSAVLRLLTPVVRAAMKQHPQTTFAVQGRCLLAYREWKLLENALLADLVRAWSEVSQALQPPK
ncbi:MAG: hypothetical protein DMG07_01540 [Acidobacteria bacterium]|nr:MAG: hypothetical protein DMG07_01540 [Acidobacteriota bacterium]